VSFEAAIVLFELDVACRIGLPMLRAFRLSYWVMPAPSVRPNNNHRRRSNRPVRSAGKSDHSIAIELCSRSLGFSSRQIGGQCGVKPSFQTAPFIGKVRRISSGSCSFLGGSRSLSHTFREESHTMLTRVARDSVLV